MKDEPSQYVAPMSRLASTDRLPSYEELYQEMLRYMHAIDLIRNCQDAKCTLCLTCITALYPQKDRPLPDPPIADDDPIRIYKPSHKIRPVSETVPV